MKEQKGLINPKQHEAGRRFGNYYLMERIDTGGMGEVYRAYQDTPAFKREVAIKIIRPDLANDLVARARFSREAEVSSQLKHEHILPLFDCGEENGLLFLVTPYIKGGTLARRLQSGPLSLSEVRQLFIPLVQAVAYIHRRGIVHRDLKPSNVLLDSDDENGEIYVRLIDFGIAKRSGAAASPPLTTAGHEMGTLAYMAPERLNGIAAPANDIYSLGVILYQMLTGRLPLGEARVPLLAPMEAVIRRCMAPDPDDRYASAAELLQGFEQACHALIRPTQTSNLTGSQRPETRALEASADQAANPAGQTGQMGQTGQVAQWPVSPPQTQAGKIGLLDEADFAAPTVDFAHFNSMAPDQNRLVPAVAASSAQIAPPARPPARNRKRKSPLFAIISVLIIFVLLIMAGLLFMEFPLVASANVNISPQVHVLREVYTITARPSQTGINVATRSIPADGKIESKTGSLSGQTTGEQCSFLGIVCKQVVSFTDVANLTDQLRQTLIAQLSTDLDRQIQAMQVTAVGSKHFTDLSQSNNPDVGTPSKTVTVTLTEQGSVEYVSGTQAQKLAQLLLAQDAHKPGAGNVLMGATVQIGQPVIEGVDSQGIVTMRIAAAGVAEYQFPASLLQSLPNHLKGMTIQQARAYLAKQPGIDPQSITIHFTLGGGNTLPFSASQIKIIPINPAHLPSASLPSVPTPAVTPESLTPSPTPTEPTATPTETDGG